MKYSIPAHDLSHRDEPEQNERDREDREEYSEILEYNPRGVDIMVGSFHIATTYKTVADPEVVELDTWEAWVADMQMHYALFKITTSPEGEPLELMINHKVRKTKATGPDYSANAGNWTTAFFLAVICREQERYRELCEIPVETLREYGESEGTRYNPYVYYWIAALQDFVLGGPDLGENLLKAMELSAPEQSEIGSAESLDKLIFPQLNAFRYLVQRDSDGFNEALAEGLVSHAEFWTTEDRVNEIDGVFHLGLLALACLAYDTAEVDPDFSLEVESGYLPKHLVRRSWYGEFPT